jgi:hypothetical protein
MRERGGVAPLRETYRAQSWIGGTGTAPDGYPRTGVLTGARRQMVTFGHNGPPAGDRQRTCLPVNEVVRGW